MRLPRSPIQRQSILNRMMMRNGAGGRTTAVSPEPRPLTPPLTLSQGLPSDWHVEDAHTVSVSDAAFFVGRDYGAAITMEPINDDVILEVSSADAHDTVTMRATGTAAGGAHAVQFVGKCATNQVMFFGATATTRHIYFQDTTLVPFIEFLDSGSGGAKLSFFGVVPQPRQTITGSRGGNVALATLLAALEDIGLIVDGTTP